MAKVFGIHKLALHSGINGEDFEQFLQEALPQIPAIHGWKVYALRGDRGDREGKYLLLFEIESVEARERFAPVGGSQTPEAEQFDQATKGIFERWGTFANALDPAFTDYVVVAETT
jgi:hypothetical protein